MNTTSQALPCRDELPIARFKKSPDDFKVEEILGFELDGEGEHLWVNARKTSMNTREVIDWLAGVFGVTARDIGHSGLKDKNAVTTQWFSLPLPIGAAIPDGLSNLAAVEIVRHVRSRKKLRIGAHRQNRFQIILRDLPEGAATIEEGLQKIVRQGFPNYFGPQRFGHGGRNVASARSMFSGGRKTTRFKRGIYLSAARSHLFNQVLAARIQDQSWLEILPGEVCILNGTNSIFECASPDDEIHKRHQQMDIHASGPLHGRGDSLCTDRVQELEAHCLRDETVLMQGLEAAGLKQERRALRSVANDLSWQWLDTDALRIDVTLQRGVYATALLGELVVLQEGDEPPAGE